MEGYDRRVRLRNLLFSIAGEIVKRNLAIDYQYSKEDISKWLYFKKRDFVYYLDCFFEKEENNYRLNSRAKKKISKIINNHNQVLSGLEDAKIVFLKIFGRFEKESIENHFRGMDFEKFNAMYSQLEETIQILHWGLLPIIPQYLMINSGKIPEENILDFYNHFHMLQAMLREIHEEGEMMTLKGDDNLDMEMKFSVYSRKWDHNDRYRIKRTIDGWDVSHLVINGKCDKNGEGALLNNLHQDTIFFPEEAVKYALENLWEEAEEGLEFERLQEKMQQIANWISATERIVEEAQPEWVNYY